MSGSRPIDFLGRREDRGGPSKLATELRMSIAQVERRKEVPPVTEAAQLARPEPFSRQLFAINTYDDALRIATVLCKTEFVPLAYRNKPESALAAIMMGAELAVAPLQALQGIAVINGRPSVYGDLALALCQRHPAFVDCIETWDNETGIAKCVIKRQGREPVVRTFSWDNAVRAGLSKKDTYQQYPERMCQMRARAFAMRDAFSDALRGVSIIEEVLDYSDGTVTTLRDVPLHNPVQAAETKQIPPVSTASEVRLPPAQKSEPVPAAPPAPAPTVHAVTGLTTPREFVIKSGKNAGRRVRDLQDVQLAWYAGECRDVQTKAAAAFELEHRRKAVAADSGAANSNGAEVIDANGQVHQVTQ